ncbi:MAG: hypothetical protein PUF06_02010 [Veillonellaceae bacterium]|nr:hypothetical protein [Veillonellaceae bacterium]
MTVPLGRRSESKLEFFHTLFKLQQEITRLFIRDFGVKPVNRSLKSFVHSAKMTEADRTVYTALCEKYHIDVEAEWPLWLIEHYRTKIIKIMDSLEENVVTANSIYPTVNDYEYWHTLRRKYQKLAQADCYRLLRAMQNICYILPVDKERLMPYVELVDKELTAIKNWQNRTNAQYKKYLANRK